MDIVKYTGAATVSGHDISSFTLAWWNVEFVFTGYIMKLTILKTEKRQWWKHNLVIDLQVIEYLVRVLIYILYKSVVPPMAVCKWIFLFCRVCYEHIINNIV
jgi:hypothetical protein